MKKITIDNWNDPIVRDIKNDAMEHKGNGKWFHHRLDLEITVKSEQRKS